jgi:hypothetical protein
MAAQRTFDDIGRPTKWDDSVRGRIEQGSNYDRLVRARKFDPLSNLMGEAMTAQQGVESLQRRLSTMPDPTDVTDVRVRRLLRAIRIQAKFATSLHKELAKLGEPRPVIRVEGTGAGGTIQVSFPFLEDQPPAPST